MDLGAVAHLSTIKGSVPVLHFFDGFRTSHEIRSIEVWDYKDLAEMVDWDAIKRFRERALNPEHPVLRGSAQNPDIFFQTREAANKYYDAFPDIVQGCMDQVNAKIGTNYKLFNYYGAPDAETVMVAMGSMCDAAEEVIDYLTSKGEKVGLIKVRLYRPFAQAKFVEAIPDTCKSIVVMDRCKEPGALGEPLYLDVVPPSAAPSSPMSGVRRPLRPGQQGHHPRRHHRRLTATASPSIPPRLHHQHGGRRDQPVPAHHRGARHCPRLGTTSCKFWGLGSDGTVGANKNSIKIIGDHTDLKVQGYFQYDSKKSGGITISHLRFGPQEIKSTYYVKQADFVACHNPAYLAKYQVVQDVKKGGTLLINSGMTVEELGQVLPADAKRHIAQYGVNVLHLRRHQDRPGDRFGATAPTWCSRPPSSSWPTSFRLTTPSSI